MIMICPRTKQFGIVIDDGFDIKRDDAIIGEGGVSVLEYSHSIVLEWVELFEGARGTHLFREVLKAIFRHFNVDVLLLESSQEYKTLYEYLGAEQEDYDEFREMWTYRLMLDKL